MVMTYFHRFQRVIWTRKNGENLKIKEGKWGGAWCPPEVTDIMTSHASLLLVAIIK